MEGSGIESKSCAVGAIGIPAFLIADVAVVVVEEPFSSSAEAFLVVSRALKRLPSWLAKFVMLVAPAFAPASVIGDGATRLVRCCLIVTNCLASC